MKKMLSKEERKIELLDNYYFGLKMIARREATQEELQSQFDEIEKELNIGYYKKKKRKQVRKENDSESS